MGSEMCIRDSRGLKRNILALLEIKEVVSLAELLERFDAEQGLGSVVGYLSLAAKHGQVFDSQPCAIAWTGADGVRRQADAPAVFFRRERAHEFQL